ncbi:MAG: hypothetical protein K5931_09495, partial [Lachnospiraceae bacterium]|nr:hypothetical protein [Lachnospiraceae bacterium]
PMEQLINYLSENDFIIYVVSESDRLVARGYIDGSINVPLNHIIGSDRSIAATGQKETSGNDYIFKKDDKLINGDEHIFTDVNLNKVVSIQREIGKQPVLCFGNSSTDYSMATYTTLNNPYMSLAFIVCCDDTKREKGNIKTSKELCKACEENGWTPISMKNDWKTVFGEDVERKKEANIEFTSNELDEKLNLNR